MPAELALFAPGEPAATCFPTPDHARTMVGAAPSRSRLDLPILPEAMRTPHRLSDETGFTLIEVMVGVFLLVIGMLAVATMVSSADVASTRNKAREGAVNLAREMLEDVRTVDYTDLTGSMPSSSGTPDPIQAELVKLGFGDAIPATSSVWDIKRRGITYDVTVFTCIYDDPHDGARASGTSGYCPSGADPDPTGSNTDSNPDDARQVEVDIKWSLTGGTPSCRGQTTSSGIQTGTGAGCVTQSALISNPSGGLGPAIKTATYTALVQASNGTVEFGSSTVTFDVTTAAAADSVSWGADDSQTGTASQVTGNTDGTKWTFPWDVTNVRDGSHTVTIQAFFLNAGGVPLQKSVNLNRFIPDAPDPVAAAADARLLIPLQPGMRSLNVALAAAMAVGEALRQTRGFP